MGLGLDRVDGERERWTVMSKVAFCFPGQGSLEAGMGREIAEAVPEAMEVFREGSEASRARSQASLLRGIPRRPRAHRGAAAGARRHQPRHARSGANARARAGLRRRPFRRRVHRARGHVVADAVRVDRARPRARSRDGRGGAHQQRVDGRDPRARRRARGAALRRDRRRVARELQLPGPARGLRGARRGRRVLREGGAEGARRTVKLRCRAPSTARSSPGPRSVFGPRSSGSSSASRWRRSCRR